MSSTSPALNGRNIKSRAHFQNIQSRKKKYSSRAGPYKKEGEILSINHTLKWTRDLGGLFFTLDQSG